MTQTDYNGRREELSYTVVSAMLVIVEKFFDKVAKWFSYFNEDYYSSEFEQAIAKIP